MMQASLGKKRMLRDQVWGPRAHKCASVSRMDGCEWVLFEEDVLLSTFLVVVLAKSEHKRGMTTLPAFLLEKTDGRDQHRNSPVKIVLWWLLL